MDLSPPLAALMSPRTRIAPLIRQWSIVILCVLFALVHIYSGVFGAPGSVAFLNTHLSIALILVFLIYPLAGKRGIIGAVGVAVDVLAVAIVIWIYFYINQRRDELDLLYVEMNPVDFVTMTALVVLVLEAARRTVGYVLIGICLLFCVHALYANHFPGVFYGPAVSFESLLQALFISDAGIFGIPVMVVAQYVVLFIIFGQLLVASGTGGFFIRLAIALFGHRTGGPAKAAVVASSFMGSLSGSPISNVLTTGTFTIPMMRRLGYKPAFAGGVEAAASTGGMVMPPVMGAVAFIMAEFLGVPYLTIMLAAIIPSVLYSFGIYVTVHLEAKRLNLRTLSKENLFSAGDLIRKEGYRALPLVAITAMLLMGYSLNLTVLVSIAFTLILALVQPRTRLTPLGLLDVVVESSRTTVGLSATVAAAGIIIGAIFATGLSFQVTQAVMAMTADQLWLILLSSAVMALILGMGLTIGAVYITMAATVIPLLVAAGVDPLAAHFFALYLGTISFITPPVAMAAFAAAPIAQAPSLLVGVQATRLGIGMFLIPFLFVYNPALLLIGTWYEIAWATLGAGLALFALSVATTGYLMAPLSRIEQAIMLVGAICLIAVEPISDLVGVGLMAAGVAYNYYRSKQLSVARGGAAAPESEAAPEDILNELTEDDTGSKFPLLNYALGAVAWLIVGATVYFIGGNRMHARDVDSWLLALVAASFAITVAIYLSVRRSGMMFKRY